MYRMMDEAGAEHRDLSSVRLWASGADAMPDDLARRFKKLGATTHAAALGRPVGEAAFVEGYGMVELGGGVAAKVLPPPAARRLAGSSGCPLPGYHMRVVDDDGTTSAAATSASWPSGARA